MKTVIPLFLCVCAALAQTGTPRVAVSLNAARNSTQYQGWPALVRVTLRHPDVDAQAAPLQLASATGTWMESISLEVRDVRGNSVSWPFVPAVRPSEATLILPPRSKVEPFFYLSGEDTRALAAGDYTIRATLSILGGAGWNGVAVSGDVRLTVAAEPPVLTPAEQLHKAELQTRWLLLSGDSKSAGREALSLVQARPDSSAANRLAAEIFEQSGRPEAAFIYAERALDLFYQENPNPREPPAALIEMTRRLRDLLVNSALKSQSPQ